MNLISRNIADTIINSIINPNIYTTNQNNKGLLGCDNNNINSKKNKNLNNNSININNATLPSIKRSLNQSKEKLNKANITKNWKF